jgi:serine/threonine-protein kinase HipA
LITELAARLLGNQKYSKANIETMVRLAARFTPDPAATVLEMVRRIVVDIMLGNGDSHLKNTSFLYADGRTPTLSPAYDIVPTIFFQKDDNLALRFNGKRAFERITPHEFERMAGYVDVSPRAVQMGRGYRVSRIQGEVIALSTLPVQLEAQ